MPDLDAAKSTLLAELREHSLVIGEVTLSSGAVAQYYVDARRALLRPAGFRAAGELIAAAAAEAGADAVGGPATAAIPLACAAIAVDGGRGPGRVLRPRRAQGAWPPALGRGAGRARHPLPRRRGHGHQRRLDRRRDRADPGGGARGRRGARRRRPTRRRRAPRSKRPPTLPTGPWSRSTRSTRTDPTGTEGDDGARRSRDSRGRLPDREAADDPRRLSALAQRPAPRLQPVDEPRPGRRLRRGDRRRGAAAPRPARLDAPRQRFRQPRPQVPPPARRGPRGRRRPDLAARGPDAARPADPRPAEAADRAPALLRRPRRSSTRPSTAWSSAAWSPATSAGRARRRIATSSCWGRPRPRSRPSRAPTESPTPSETAAPEEDNGSAPTDRLERVERELAELREQLETLRSELGGG